MQLVTNQMTYGLWAPGDSELYVALAKYQVRENLDEYWGVKVHRYWYGHGY